MKTLAKTLASTLVAAGLSAALVTPAFAANPFEEHAPRPTMQVRTADLDLATEAGQRTLDKRVETAVRQVCRVVSPRNGTRILDQGVQECKARARAEAQSQVAALMDRNQRGG